MEEKYPSIPLESLWQVCNFSQLATADILRLALKFSSAEEEKKQKYKEFVGNNELLEEKKLRCFEVYETLEPGYSFMTELGINTVRPYTLASWDPESKYLDLVVSLV